MVFIKWLRYYLKSKKIDIKADVDPPRTRDVFGYSLFINPCIIKSTVNHNLRVKCSALQVKTPRLN